MFASFGPLEIGLVLLIVLVIFGPKRLPGLGKQLGKGMREFKESIGGESDDEKNEDRPARASNATLAAAPAEAAPPAASAEQPAASAAPAAAATAEPAPAHPREPERPGAGAAPDSRG